MANRVLLTAAMSVMCLSAHAAITDQLVLHLAMDGSLTDTSGLNHHGTPVGQIQFGTGQVGSGAVQLSFNKAGTGFNYVTLGAPEDFNFGLFTDFTASLWVKFSQWVFDPPFIGNKDWLSGQYQGWILATATDGHLQWNYGGQPGQRKDYDGPPGSVSDGQWHHIVLTVLRAGEAVTYLDGVAVDERDVSASLNNVSTPAGQSLNLGQDGTGRYTDGNSVEISDLMMDDVGLWRRVLTRSEVEAIYAAGKSGKDLTTVASIPESPVLMKQPTDQSVVAGDSVLFRVLPRGTSPFTFQWRLNAKDIPGKTNAILEVSNAQASDAGGYSCVVANGVSSVLSNEGVLSVDTSLPPTIRRQPVAISAAIGSRVVLSVDASGVAPLTYQWFKDDAEISGATAATHILSRIKPEDAAKYKVKVRSANGLSEISSEAVLSIVSDIRQGLVAHYTFDADYSDSSGRGNHGNPVGNPSLVDGFIGGKSLRYSQKADGSEFNYVTLGQPSDLEFSVDADFSFSFWTKFSKWERDPLFVSNKRWSSGGNVGYALATGGDGRLQWNYAEQVGERRDFDSGPGLVSDGRWHHVAVTFQRGVESVTFVDGIEVNRQPLPTTGTTISPGLPTNIGQDGSGTYTDNNTVSITDGTLDDLAIWRRAITLEEIRAIYRRGLQGANVQETSVGLDLVAYLPFEDDFSDHSGRGHHGLPVGSPTFGSGKVGKAIGVTSIKDGSSFNYVTLGAPAELDFGRESSFSIALWARFNTWTGDPVLIGNKDWRSGGNQGWSVATGGNGRLQWNLGDGDAGGRTRSDYDGPEKALADGNWHHVVIAVERGQSTRTYLDGKLVDTAALPADLDSVSTAAGLALNIGQDGRGAYTDNGNAGMRDLWIDEVALWRRALTASDVALIQARGSRGENLFGRAPSASSFPNGVAAGDATANSIVLWTRSTAIGAIQFQVSTDPAFELGVASSSVQSTNASIPVKVGFSSLSSGTSYHYRVVDAAGNSAHGVFKTLPAPDSKQGLRFGVSGDIRGELGAFPSIGNVPSKSLDFFVLLGDTIYADVPSTAVPQPQARTLDEYRRKHEEVNSTRLGVNHLGNLRSSTAVYAMIDDHEVTDDFAGGAAVGSDPRFDGNGVTLNDTELYKNGLRAFSEFHPIQDGVYAGTGSSVLDGKPMLYRARRSGRDAAFFLLDARSFRDRELVVPEDVTDPVQVGAYLARTFDINPLNGQPLPRRTMLGKPQLELLKADLLAAHRSGVIWKFVMVPEPIQNLGVLASADRFEGYAAERSELLGFIETNHVSNVVFVSADIHGTLVNNLTYQLGPGQKQIPTASFEISTGAIAYDAPFGPTVLDLAADVSIGNQSLLDVFLKSLGIPNRTVFDAVLTPAQKNQALRGLVDGQVVPLGYTPVGLGDSGLDAQLIQGDPAAVFSYGWTEFTIAPDTAELRITTHGIEPYTKAQMNADVLLRSPKVLQEFTVQAARPTLQFQQGAGQLILSWDAWFADFDLEMTGSLTSNAVWSQVTSVLEGGRRVVHTTVDGDRYFRLRQK